MKENNTIIYETVLTEMARLNLLLPIQVEDTIVEEKAVIFAEELLTWDPLTIKTAFRECGRKSRFFPALAEVIEECRQASQALEYRRQRERAALPRPEDIPEKTRILNLEKIKKLRKALNIGANSGAINRAGHQNQI